MAFNNSGTKAVACNHPQKGVNNHFSSSQLVKQYAVGKLSSSEAKICSFSRIGQKINNYSSLKFFARKPRKILFDLAL